MIEKAISLPVGWESVLLSDLCDKIGDVDHRMPKAEADGIPYVSTEDFRDNGAIDYANAKRISCNDFESLCRKIRPEYDDLLLSRYGTIGEVRVVRTHRDFQASYAIAIIKPVDRSLTDYLSRVLTSPSVTKQIQKYIRATAQPNLGLTHIRDFQIPVPPEAEQRRIVAKIESLQERSRQAREALAEVGPLLEQFRQSLLAAAFRGDLTADWRAANPNVEPASELLNRIRQERRQKWEHSELAKYKAKAKQPPAGWQDTYKEPEPVEEASLPELPEGWCWASFEEVASIESKLVSPADFPDHPHIAPDKIEKATGRLLAYRTIAKDGVTSSKNHFFPGQIVYSKIRPYLSKVIIAEFEGLCSADMYPISTPLDLSYLFRYMLSNYFLYAVQKEAGNRVVLPKVNQEQLNAVAVPIAPIAEQAEIAWRITKSAESHADMVDEVSGSETALTQLDQSILAKAFRGELVPQDPNDEPASALLARIRAPRDAAEASLRKPKKKSTQKRINNNKG